MSDLPSIVLLAMACRLPDANTPGELWANVVEGRRSFRAFPKERLDLSRYDVDVIGESDSITPIRAALLTNWRIDRNAFRIPNKTFQATDLTHWLALELAAEAFSAIGGLGRIDRARTAVVVANTLTGEFSRAGLLRLRLPFLEELLVCACDRETPSKSVRGLRERFAAALRERFPEPNEDSLAGGLANTIAGRIANYFDLRGGAYSVDGACASSLVALANAANLLVTGQVDAAMVVGVDLSLDPFELVGFSRNGALATDEMRVFDARASGFWPGEGGACVLLMREDGAARADLPMLARIRGWGISSDGSGGLTRPSSEGQLLAYRRAHEMAGVMPADIAFVEAHGTGTAVGDPIEVRALAALRDGVTSSLPVGSIKANIGHTKAAAGLAGLVKVVEALRHRVVPPHVSCSIPHAVFAEVDHRIRPIMVCEPFGDRQCELAGVSSFGFGGINAHVVIERAGSAAIQTMLPRPPISQDVELFLFSGDCQEDVVGSIAAFERRVPTLSMAEFTDAAAYVASSQANRTVRAAVIASNSVELAQRLNRAKSAIAAGESLASVQDGIFVGRALRPPRIGFLFPGQGAPCRPAGGIWRRRFGEAARLVALLAPDLGNEPSGTDFGTEIVQPVVTATSLAALRVLERFDITACCAVGHSLGEIAALAWAGVLDFEAALALARARGALMAELGSVGGAMLRVALSPDEAARLATGIDVVVACHNGPDETVLSGAEGSVAMVARRSRERGIEASRLDVSHAFHSPDMAPAATALSTTLTTVPFSPITRTVISTVTGVALDPHTDFRKLLVGQLTRPVLFDAALAQMAKQVDVFIEIGPGQGLTRLARSHGRPALSVDAFGNSLTPHLAAVGALFVMGTNVNSSALFDDRCVRAFDPLDLPRFIESPCGHRPEHFEVPKSAPPPAASAATQMPRQHELFAVVRSAIAAETGMALDEIRSDDRFLETLHLNSLAVSCIVIAAARAAGTRAPAVPTEFANSTPRLLADALAELRDYGDNAPTEASRIVGVRPWVRTYAMAWAKMAASVPGSRSHKWSKVILGKLAHPSDQWNHDCRVLIWIDGALASDAASRLIVLTAAAAKAGVPHLALCHDGAPVSAFARSVASEKHFRSVRVIDRAGAAASDSRVTALLATDGEGYEEWRLCEGGGIEQPVFVPTEPRSSASANITASDVVVVVGGAKGIAAECALCIAERGAAVILIGRSAADDQKVAATLARAERMGLHCSYLQADVLDRSALAVALKPALRAFGPATVLLFAPAVNEPRRVTELDNEMIEGTLTPKTLGLAHALEAAGPILRCLITFGSVIGRLGLEGEAHYALANAMQTAAAEAWAAALPERNALAIEWSVWGSAGMAERLGTVERLAAMGVDALSVDDALDIFRRLLDGGASGTVAVTSRFACQTPLALGAKELPLLRFVDEPKVHFPDVELVIETTLARGRDLYLDDHVIDGDAVMPAVIGLEAMAQVVSALLPLGPRVVIRDVAFSRAVRLGDNGTTRIRIAALRNGQAVAEAVLFAEDDGFSAPCMRGTFGEGRSDLSVTHGARRPISGFAAAPLYGPLFFSRGRFERLGDFAKATSRHVCATILRATATPWFGPYEPNSFLLWDPGAADATLHALQVAVPHKRVLPVSVERIDIDVAVGTPARMEAIEKQTSGNDYTFDLVATDGDERTAYRWTNVTFHAVDKIDAVDLIEFTPALAAPYVERLAREILADETIEIAIVSDRNNSREIRRTAALRMFGAEGDVARRADGRPIRIDSNGSISLAHCDGLTLAVSSSGPVGCDIEMSDGACDTATLHRHVASEVCRKLGHRPAQIPDFAPGKAIVIGDVTLMAVELTLADRPCVIAIGRARLPGAAPLRLQQISLGEVVS